MKIRHPYAGINKRLTLPEDVRKYVEGLKELPAIAHEERVKDSWKEQGLQVKGKDGKLLGKGVVPGGDYTDPSTKEARQALHGLYRALKGRPITRSLAAVALNFQISDVVDTVREGLAADGVKDIDPGGRGKSVRLIGDRATWKPEPKVTGKAGEKTPAKAPATKTVAKKAAAKNGGNGATKAPAKAPAAKAAPKPDVVAEQAAKAKAAAPAAPAPAPAEAPAPTPPVETPVPTPAAG